MSQSMQNDITAPYDITIVGGGLSGLLTAVSLLEQCVAKDRADALRIALIDASAISASTPTDKAISFDDRVIALAHGSVEYLKQLNVWHLMEQDATPIADIHISDRGHYGKARIKASDHSVEALGYVIPLASIAKGLIAKLKAASQITWYTPEVIANIAFEQAQVIIQLNSSKTIATKLIVACDGGQSICRKAANISVESHDYQQAALIANVTIEKTHNNCAFERFTEFGPIAMLPMAGNQCSLVWTLTPALAEQMSALSENAFCQALTDNFGTWLGAITNSSRRSIFPLSLVKAETQTFHRLALVGNASHTIHPIAGQGFNLGLRDVHALTELIANAVENKGDIGSGKVLNQYQLKREQDQSEVITLTDSMVTLFSNELPPLVAGRNIGLKVMNYLSPLQSTFVNKTMGY